MTVTYPMTLQLLGGNASTRPLPADFRYSASDPLAVTVIFDPGSDSSVTWIFARDLLADGLSGPAGIGDISVQPDVGDDGRRALWIRLSSPDGDAYIQAPADGVAEFLALTWQMIPPGDEGTLIDMDLALATLLNGA